MTTHSPIRIGVLGAAAIVPSALTNPARNVPEVQVTTIAARDPQRAEKFARTHHIPPRPINAALAGVFSLEALLVNRVRFPWGTSILAVLQR